MKAEQLMRIAREAGNVECDCCWPELQDYSKEELAGFLERFAVLLIEDNEKATNRAAMIRDWVKQTIPALAFSASDEELEGLAKLIGDATREECAQECEIAYRNGYSTLGAASLIRNKL